MSIKKLFNKILNHREDFFPTETQLSQERAKTEARYFKEHADTEYNYFGYFSDHEDALPFFVETPKKGQHGTSDAHFFTPYTPALLKHCVMNLSEEALAKEYVDLEAFEEKCKKIALYTCDNKQEWIDTICDLKEFLVLADEILNYADRHEGEPFI